MAFCNFRSCTPAFAHQLVGASETPRALPLLCKWRIISPAATAGSRDGISAAPPADERAFTPPFRVPRFHRTLSSWLNLLVTTGFMIEQLGEPMADEATAAAFPTVADTRVAPLFLHVRACK